MRSERLSYPDRAFRRLAHDLTGQWIKKEADIIPALLTAVGGDMALVNAIVEYHVVPGKITSRTALARWRRVDFDHGRQLRSRRQESEMEQGRYRQRPRSPQSTPDSMGPEQLRK